MSKEIKKHDEDDILNRLKNDKIIRGYHCDENNNLIYYTDSVGFSYWQKFDKNNNIIHYRDNNGKEEWYKWVEGKQIKITEQEFINKDKVSRFELMDI